MSCNINRLGISNHTKIKAPITLVIFEKFRCKLSEAKVTTHKHSVVFSDSSFILGGKDGRYG